MAANRSIRNAFCWASSRSVTSWPTANVTAAAPGSFDSGRTDQATVRRPPPLVNSG